MRYPIAVSQILVIEQAPGWLVAALNHAIIAGILLIAGATTMMLQVWVERRVIARMQDRLGPNRVGPEGILQSIADGIKMFTKEDIVPRAADRWVHLLAPIVALAPIAMMLAVLPWGRGLVAVDLEVGVLYIAAVSSISGVGLMMAGWGSRNTFALLGAMRSIAQLIAYEIPLIIALLGIVLLTGGMSLARMPELQSGIPLFGSSIPGAPDLGLGWFIFTPVGLLGGIIFFICALAEGERTPFDIPEADSEIVAGYMTEYSGMKFAVFYIAQYLLNFALAVLTAVVFLGGWQGPGVAWLADAGLGAAASLLSLLWLLLKAWAIFVLMVIIRAAVPRLRVDQLMAFAWKYLLPLALVNVASAALWVGLTQWSSIEWGNLIPIDALTPWQRIGVAAIVTAVLNISATRWVLRINRAPAAAAVATIAPA